MGGEAAQAVDVAWWLELWREFRREFFVALIVAAVSMYYGRHSAVIARRDRMEKDILADASARDRLAATLTRSRAAAFYQRALSGALAWADQHFGPEGEPYALAWSLWLALAYSWCLFWGIWGAGGSSEVFGTKLGPSLPEQERWIPGRAVTVGLALIWFGAFRAGQLIGYLERLRVLKRLGNGEGLWKRRLPLALGLGGLALTPMLGRRRRYPRTIDRCQSNGFLSGGGNVGRLRL